MCRSRHRGFFSRLAEGANLGEALEGTLMLASHTLALMGVPVRRVLRAVQNQRGQRYRLLRGYFRNAEELMNDEDAENLERLSTLVLDPASCAVGQTFAQIQPTLAAQSVTLVSLRRASGSSLVPRSEMVLAPGDTLVMSGRQQELQTVVAMFSRPTDH